MVLHDGRLSAGRSGANDVVLAGDAEASRVHAEIERIGSDWTIVDDGLSKNGTFVNGRRITRRCRLQDGCVIRMGTTTVTFRDPSRGSTAATAAAQSPPLTHALNEGQRRILAALCAPYRDADAYGVPATNAEIAASVFLGIDAVKGHLRQLYRMFGLSELPRNQKRSRLAEIALREGLGETTMV